MVSGNASTVASRAVATSPASDEVDDLNNVSTGEGLCCEPVAVAKDRAIVLDNDEPRIDAQGAEELRQCAIPRNLPESAVHRQGDDLARFRSSNHELKDSA